MPDMVALILEFVQVSADQQLMPRILGEDHDQRWSIHAPSRGL
jgi:hypothetical protein